MTDYFVHPHGIVEPGAQIGARTRVWAFTHVLPGAKIGEDCNICDNCFVENDVILGDRVTVKPFVPLPDGMRIEDDVFIGPNAAFTNDHFPRSKGYEAKLQGITIRKGASIGANAVVLPGVTVGRNAMVGSGSVVSKDVPPNAVVMGIPARVVGFVNSERNARLRPIAGAENMEELKATGAALVTLKTIHDPDGSLSVNEFAKLLPFTPRRYFVVYDVPEEDLRGHHAHRVQHEFLTCIRGSCHVMVDDGQHRAEVVLDSPELGLHLPPKRWAAQYKYSSDAALVVLSSGEYEAEDYIHDYEEFLALVGVK
jgi:acetyltransferase-like isoleucine patch superfamily enzyme